MSAQRTVPAARAADTTVRGLVLAAVTVAALATAYYGGKRAGAVHEVMAAAPAEATRVAFVRKQPCRGGWCETLWIGDTRDHAVRVGSLAPGTERCEEIAWAKDGFRVGFLVNGYQLRIFDGASRAQVGQVNLFDPDGTPTSHFARGITFSQNGAAVTFDDCPRARSGCKSGLVAVR